MQSTRFGMEGRVFLESWKKIPEKHDLPFQNLADRIWPTFPCYVLLAKPKPQSHTFV